MLLALKLALTPLLIIAAALAGRRWGSEVSGWLIGLPLTSGPISVLLCLQYGPEFAAQATPGNMSGYSAIAVYCLVYRLLAPHTNWLVSISLSTGVYFAVAGLLNGLAFRLGPAYLIVLLTLLLVLRWMPAARLPVPPTAPPRWDIPLRVTIATGLVLALTTLASTLGPQLSGLLSTFPLFATVLVVFAHHQQGPEAAIAAMRGVVIGEFSAAAFFLVVGLGAVALQLWIYPIAIAAALLVNGVSLRFVSASPRLS